MQTSAVRLSHRAPDVARRAALALAAALLAGCGFSFMPDSYGTLSELDFELSTSEWEPGRNLLVVGESGSVQVAARTHNPSPGQCSDVMECPLSVDVEIRSTDPAVVAPVQQRVRTPARVAIVAHAPGTAVVSAAVAGVSRERRVDVVAAPLPVDSVRIWALEGGDPSDPPIATDYAGTGQLVHVTLPVMGYAALFIKTWRNQVEVYMPWTAATSSDSAVAWLSWMCRAPVVDPNCQRRFGGGWVTGLAPGDATGTITVHNLQTSFAVTVK